MPFNWNLFPWTRFNEINLDWFLTKFREMTNQLAGYDQTVEQAHEVSEAASATATEALETANGIDAKATQALETANGIDAKATQALSTANQAQIDASRISAQYGAKRIVFIGDSYATGTGGGVTVTPWPTLFTDHLITAGIPTTTFNYSEGGYGFAHEEFAGLLRTAHSDIGESAGLITDVIFGGGVNDWGDSITEASLYGSVWSAVAEAQGYFPNARIYVALINCSLTPNIRRATLTKVRHAYNRGAHKGGAVFLDCLDPLLRDKSLFLTDNVHVNQDGQNKIADYMVNLYRGGSPNKSLDYYQMGTVDFSQSGAPLAYVYYDGDRPYFQMRAQQMTCNFNVKGTFQKIATYTDMPVINGSGYAGSLVDVNSAMENFTLMCSLRTGASGARVWHTNVAVTFKLIHVDGSNDVELWARQIGSFTSSGTFESFDVNAFIPQQVIVPLNCAFS